MGAVKKDDISFISCAHKVILMVKLTISGVIYLFRQYLFKFFSFSDMVMADFLAVGYFVMKKYMSGLAFATIIGIASVLSCAVAQAAPYVSLEQFGSSLSAPANLLKQVGYYGDSYDGDHYDRHGHGYDHDGGYDCYTRYEKKYVCESSVPRCFKQRKCIWYYGREYCRYVRKCVGGDRYCKWINVPIKDCGCRKCW